MGVMYFDHLKVGHVPADYTIFVGVSWNIGARNGAAAYMVIDKKGENKWSLNGRIANTNIIRMVLLSIWSGLRLVPDRKTVRVVTNNNAIIYTLSKKNIRNDKCSDLKAHIIDELSRINKAYISRPLSATDESYVSMLTGMSDDARYEYEQKHRK
jgi:hypothetical protein